jgi:perosamine synthetase
MKKHGIGTRPFFRGLHNQPALRDMDLFKNESYPKTDFASQFGFYLPSGLTLTESDINKVVKALKDSLNL